MRRKLTIVIIVIIAIELLLLSITGINNQKEPKQTITIAIVPSPVYALVYIAEYKDYFQDEGVDVKYKHFTTGKMALLDALSGNSDTATVYETPVVRKIYEGEDVSIITTLHFSSKNSAIIGLRDRGIVEPRDLKGKRIGVVKGTANEFFLFLFLSSQGLKISDVTVVNTREFKNYTKLLSDNTVDAVAVTNPFAYGIYKEIPENNQTVFKLDTYIEYSMLAGRHDIIDSKEIAFEKLLKALHKAEVFIDSNPDEALDIVIRSLPDYSDENIRATWKDFTPKMKLNNVFLTSLEQEGQWFKDNNIYESEVPNFRRSINLKYLRTVNPDAVTIYEEYDAKGTINTYFTL